jgi:hypothetical protein
VKMKSVKTHKMMHKLCMAFVVLFAALATAHADVDWSQFECSFSVKFPGYRGSSTLTDFPVLIRLSAALNDFNYSKCADNGADIRFSDSDGNLLSHEIDTWNTNGESLVWVKVPTLNKDTTITAYYGCATPPAVTASDVWTNGYVGVWHLGAANDTTQKDSTTNRLDFICADGDVGKVDLAVSAGAVGGAVGFNRDETKKGGLSVSDNQDVLAGSDDLTLEAWIYPTQIDASNNRAILSKRASTSSATYYVYANKDRSGTPTISVSKGSDDPSVTYPGAKTDPPPLNSWTHMAFTRVGSTKAVKEYLDGTNLLSVTQTGTAGSLYNGGYSVVLGNDKTTSASCFPGNIDEVRISSVARSAEWVQATRDTIADDGFAAYDADNDWEKYSHKFTVSFPGGPEGVELSNFPVLVKIAEYDENAGTGIQGFSYGDCLKPNGGDLRFADSNGALLYSEVEIWNPQGESLVWVKVPTLTKGTKITGYYGWLLAPLLDPAEVWDENYVGVWHMDENNEATKLADSTSNARSFVRSTNYPDGMTNGVSGVAGSSVKFNGGDSKGQYAIPDSAGNFDGFDAITVEVWTWQDDHDATENSKARYIFRKYDGGSVTSWAFHESGGNATPADNGKYSFQFYSTSSDGLLTIWINGAWTKPSRANWNHSVSVWDGNAGVRNSYLNGLQLSSYSAEDAYKGQLRHLTTSNAKLCLGNNWDGTAAQFPGKLDEVRISKVARSSEWIKATYDTIKDNATFTSYGAAQENAKGGFIIIVR